jgi:hypothetical protein
VESNLWGTNCLRRIDNFRPDEWWIWSEIGLYSSALFTIFNLICQTKSGCKQRESNPRFKLRNIAYYCYLIPAPMKKNVWYVTHRKKSYVWQDKNLSEEAIFQWYTPSPPLWLFHPNCNIFSAIVKYCFRNIKNYLCQPIHRRVYRKIVTRKGCRLARKNLISRKLATWRGQRRGRTGPSKFRSKNLSFAPWVRVPRECILLLAKKRSLGRTTTREL